MKFRYPAVPLVTHSPYFSLWSMDDVPNRTDTCHWTGKPQPLTAVVEYGKRKYNILGCADCPPMRIKDARVEACATEYLLESPELSVTLRFTSPLLPDDLTVLARPITYITVKAEARCEAPSAGSVKITLAAHESLCLDHPGQSPVRFSFVKGKHFTAATFENTVQKPLNRAGDDVRADWGTLYLAAEGGEAAQRETERGLWAAAEKHVKLGETALFAIAYDEVKCIQYFGRELDPLWKEECAGMPELLDKAFAEFASIDSRCRAFDGELTREAVKASGSEKYAQLLQLSYRQVIAAHGLCREENGGLLFISKECFSNGCAATADVSYPSVPLFLLYRPELVFGMLRPIFRYAESDAWPFDFAPHDAGTYPLLNGQAYSGGTDPKNQMPVEECGNLLLMTAAATLATGDFSFAEAHWESLSRWAGYLRKNGLDPENQLCTDDFAGHLAHNCNLAIKAILGVGAFGLLQKGRGDTEKGEETLTCAREMAAEWVKRAANGDGTYRLAFDRENTFSLKYNAVWDELLHMDIFPRGTWKQELRSYLARKNRYGTPLDNRAGYAKSDWLVWAASMMKDNNDFDSMVAPLWEAYNAMPQRVPLSDWYETEDAWQVIYSKDRDWRGGGFQNRTVQGGLFMKLLWSRKVS